MFQTAKTRRTWSEHDIRILRQAVHLHGEKWSLIANTYNNNPDHSLNFQISWSNVDIKDKWRNLKLKAKRNAEGDYLDR